MVRTLVTLKFASSACQGDKGKLHCNGAHVGWDLAFDSVWLTGDIPRWLFSSGTESVAPAICPQAQQGGNSGCLAERQTDEVPPAE